MTPISPSRPGRLHKKSETNLLIILLVWAAGLGAAAQFGKVAVALDAFRDIYPRGEVALGFLISCVGTVGLIFGVVGGIIISGFGIRRAMVAGLLIAGVLSAVQSLMLPFPVMIALRILEGATHLAIVIAGPILMARHSSDAARPAVMTLWSSFFGLSYMLTALIAPALLGLGGLPGVLLAHSLFMITLAACLWLALPGAVITPAQPIVTATPRLTLAGLMKLHVVIYRSPRTSAAALGFVCYTGLYIALLTYLPGFVDAARRAPMAASLPLASIVTSLILGIMLLRYVPPVRAVQIGFGVTALSALPLMFTLGHDGLFILSCLLLMGATGFVPGASFATLADLNHSDDARAHATGALAQMGNVGTTCGPPVLAAIIAMSGLAGTVMFILLCSVTGITVHSVLARRRALAMSAKD